MSKKTVLGDDSIFYNRKTPEQEKEQLRGLPLKKKLAYIKDYYLKAAIIIGICVAVIGYFIFMVVRPKDDILLRVIAINDYFTEENTQTIIDDFGKTINYNPDKEDIQIEDEYLIDPNRITELPDTITTFALAGTLDIIIADEEVFTLYAKDGFFVNLEEVLSKEDMATLKEDLFYTKRNPMAAEDIDPDNPPTDVDTSEHAYGVCLDDSVPYTNISSWYQQQKTSGSNVSYYIGILNSSRQKENGKAFIEFLKGMR